MHRIIRSIPIKISLCILVIETVVLALVGWYCSDRFAEMVDMNIAERLTLPAQLMSLNALEPGEVEDVSILSALLQAEVKNAFLIGADGIITHAVKPEIVGNHYLSYLSKEEKRALGPGAEKERSRVFVNSAGDRWNSSLTPVYAGQAYRGSLYLKTDGEESAALKKRFIQLFIAYSLVVTVVVTLLISWIVNRMLIPRIDKVTTVLSRIADGDFSARIVANGSDDQLGRMMKQVNSMISRIQQYTRTLQTLNTVAECFAHARSKEHIVKKATELVEQHLPVHRVDTVVPQGDVSEGRQRSRAQETVFTLPVTDDENSYQVLVFSATDEFKPLNSVERDFVETLSRMVNVAVDRVTAFQEISTAEARYRHLFTSALEGIMRVRPEGAIIEANPALARMGGYDSVEEVIAQVTDIGRQMYLDPLDFAQLKLQLETEERVLDREVKMKRRDGTVFPVSVSAYTVRDENGRLQSFDLRLFDIAERKLREQAERDQLAAESVSLAKSRLVNDLEWNNKQLLEALNELKAAQMQLMQSEKMAAVGMTAGGVAHDLNNILAGVSSYPELLLDMVPQDSEIFSMLKKIQRSGMRASAIVADLLALTEGVVKEKRRVQLESIVSDFMRSTELSQMLARYPEIVIDTDLSDGNMVIDCSPVHIQKMLMNLVINAIEMMDGKGSIIIATAVRSLLRGVDVSGDETADRFAVLTVFDSGPGIPREHLKHVFEPFYIRKAMGKSGTGLGLTVVWNVVNEHNGTIEVDSEQEGTVFNMFFPLAGKVSGEEETEIASAGEELQGKGKILVIDDEPLQRDIALKMLNRFGYEVECCNSGEEAVSFLENEQVDLLLLDMLMPPGINGLETYQRILKLHPNQKAIIVSGYSENRDVKRAMQLGAGTFVKKPYTMHQIAQSVKKELESEYAE